jgi:hypothetical protein
VILEVNRKPIRNVREFNEAIEGAQKKGKVLLRVTSGNWTRYILLPLSED